MYIRIALYHTAFKDSDLLAYASKPLPLVTYEGEAESVMQALEHVWQHTQNVFDYPWHTALPDDIKLSYQPSEIEQNGFRSTSMGDIAIVEVDGKRSVWICAMIGWNELPLTLEPDERPAGVPTEMAAQS